MMGLRKFFVLSAALALALVGSGTALGQDFCSVTSPNSGVQVRAEGIAEEVDEIVMSCIAGEVAAKTNMKVVVDLGDAIITNTIVSNGNKEVNDVELRMYATNAAYTADADWEATPPSGAAGRSDKGKIIGNSSVEFVLNTPEVPAATDKFRLRIRGIRINAAAVGAGSRVTATLSATGVSIFDADTVVARPVVGLKSKRIGYVNSANTTVNEPVEGLACAASKKISDAARDNDQDITIVDIEVAEGFATAFQTSMGGARIRLSFNDIPAGVKVYLRPSPDCSFEAGGSGHKRVVTPGENVGDPPVITYEKNAAGAAGMAAEYMVLTLKNGVDANGAGVGSNAVPGDDDDNYVEVSLSNGSGTATYEFDNHGGAGNDNCDIPIAFAWGSGVELGAGTVSASFAPVSSVAAAHVDAVVPRFIQTGSAMEVINIEDCSTTLLFPFVTNRAGYETDIVISNTSQDAFGTTENTGACTIYYYGSMMGGAAAPSTMTSDSIAAGEQLVVQLSSEAAGFQGYLMARCDFQFAHGIALLTDGAAGGVPTFGQGYLALVVPVQHGDRGVGSGGHERLRH